MVAGIVFCSPLGVSGEILKATGLEEINSRVEKVTKTVPAKEVWAVYNVDQTLTKPADSALDATNLRQHRDALRKLFSGLTAKQVGDVKLLSVAKTPHVLVEKNGAEVIGKLQKLGVAAFGITSSPCGTLPGEKGQRPFYAIQANRLNELDIHFEKAFPFKRVFLQSFARRDGSVPTYYNGVLLSNGESKGAALVALLKNCKTQPKVVIAVDENGGQLREMGKHLRKQFPKINFIGYEYVAPPADAAVTIKPIGEEDFLSFWKPLVDRVKKFEAINHTKMAKK
ncbi:MAG: DUF2608 domain-containing protein [Puniceicoccales bacterium]|jgi:hypothetical protein|nr:DUF2608 domain-containing protein [Puniceicoccales bacterium]